MKAWVWAGGQVPEKRVDHALKAEGMRGGRWTGSVVALLAVRGAAFVNQVGRAAGAGEEAICE